MYAFVTDNTATPGRLPKSARRLDTGQWVMGLAAAPVELVEACGWYTVTSTDPPAHTANETVVAAITVVKGRPVQTWTVAPLDAEALAVKAQEAVRSGLHTRQRQALADNAAYLAIVAPTNGQAIAQIRALTRQVNALIRVAVGSDLLVNSTDV